MNADAAGLRAARTRLMEWFQTRGWSPAPFQKRAWARGLAGGSGLIVTPTGSGKTLAAFGGALLEAMCSPVTAKPVRGAKLATGRIKVLWVTPLRALANDTVVALRDPLDALQTGWTVAMRTGDASARDRRLARSGQAEVLVITPESLALMLSYPDCGQLLGGVRWIVVDEWHELMGNKRGVLLQLGLARVRAMAPEARTWGLSATLGNLQEAAAALLPVSTSVPEIIDGAARRKIHLHTLLPDPGEHFPWAGHLGMSQLQRVSQLLAEARSSVVFTNTRAQAELWHKALSSVWLDAPDTLALHHGSMSQALRAEAEHGLRDGSVRCVVATSSLDLGVDFPAVDQVFQIGSPKGVARLIQRAGRSRHRPGEASRIICVPTHALEVVEYAAVRAALLAGHIESRAVPQLSLDVLAQHCVTLALGGGFSLDQLLREVRGSYSFRALTDQQFQEVLDFIVRGGAALEHYPDFRRVEVCDDGIYRVVDRRVALRHRLNIGTITSDGSFNVRLLKGGSLGSVEEAFIARLKTGDVFQFAGRSLQLARIQDMTAYVRIARVRDGRVPKWAGGRMPLSNELGRQMLQTLQDDTRSPEMRFARGLLDVQATLSQVPAPDRSVAEFIRTRDGWHLFVYPFAGRIVNEGLAALLALRWGRIQANTFGYAANDYGLVVSAQAATDVDAERLSRLLDPHDVLQDLLDGVNLAELARRQFREVARVAGLLPPSLPGRAPRSMRQLQASSGLIFDVLRQHDPDHVLLRQAQHEVMEQQLDIDAITHGLEVLRSTGPDLRKPTGLTPFSFPLWAESMRGQLSTEDWKTRIARTARQLEERHERMLRRRPRR